MCKELYQYHRSCGGDESKLCVCNELCPHYVPYFTTPCSLVGLNPQDYDYCKTCPNRSMDDQRDRDGAIMPTSAPHQCPKGNAHMRGADFPVTDPNHSSARQRRDTEVKESFARQATKRFLREHAQRSARLRAGMVERAALAEPGSLNPHDDVPGPSSPAPPSSASAPSRVLTTGQASRDITRRVETASA